MKHCCEARPVALSKSWSSLWAHTPTVHPPPVGIPGRKLSRSGEWASRKQDGANERARGTRSYWPPPTLPTSLLSCPRKSELNLLTAFMIWHSRKMSENCHKCFQRENKPDPLFAHRTAGAGLTQSDWKWKKGQFGFLHLQNTVDAGLLWQHTKIQFMAAPFQTGHRLCSQDCTHRWGGDVAMHITNRSHVSSMDLFCSKLFCAGAVFSLVCVLALCVSLSVACIMCSGGETTS